MTTERALKDIELSGTRLLKMQSDFENQVTAADAMAAENQARVAELKVGIITCVNRKWSGRGSFFPACQDLERMYNHSFPACTFFLAFKVEISLRTLIPLFRPGSVHRDSGS